MSQPSQGRRARRRALAWLDDDGDEDLFRLRDAIVTDPDAEARVVALDRLREAGAPRLVPYLRDATDDVAPIVRAAAFDALARAGDASALPLAELACRTDRSFRVRRAAVSFAARCGGDDALPILAQASVDPFWRVRIAARRAGSRLDAPVDLRGSEGASVEPCLPEIFDADPAVVEARLSRVRGVTEPLAMVPLLAHSHRALRRIAICEIGARGDDAALRATAMWLADDRVPNAPDAADAALARAGTRAAAVADDLSRREVPAGVLAWALRTTTAPPSWSVVASHLAHADGRVRRAAVLLVPRLAPNRDVLIDTMSRHVADEDRATQLLAMTWLAKTPGRAGREALLRVSRERASTRARWLLVDFHRRHGDTEALRTYLSDAHAAVRAFAVSCLDERGAIDANERAALASDPDPWIRHAITTQTPTATGPVPARRLLTLARGEDFGLRSAATDELITRTSEVEALLSSGDLDVNERSSACTVLALSGRSFGHGELDPTVQAHVELLRTVTEGRSPDIRPAPQHQRTNTGHERALGRSGLLVQPFGLSGAHGLTFDDFALAHATGVNLFFWEPGHNELGRFLRARRASDAVVVAGTYNCDGDAIERDVVRTLRATRREAVDVFLAFWTRSVARIDEVTDTLQRLARRGLIRATGLSTHDRALACLGADRGLDVVMVRHSAAHRGAETAVFPHCAASGTGVLTFSNLCYGRMLHRTTTVPVTAPDCYRYSLSQPGVHACIAAPRRHSELVEDLSVVATPSLSSDQQVAQRAHGDVVYARGRAWAEEGWRVGERRARAPMIEGDASERFDEAQKTEESAW